MIYPNGITIGFTGTQEGMSDMQKNQLKLILKIMSKYDTITFHHGDCIGADCEAHKIALEVGAHIVIHPPSNPKKRAYCKNGKVLPEKDYLYRNRNIVDSCKLLFGAPKQNQEPTETRAGGTWYTIRYAKSVKKYHLVTFPNGKYYIACRL